ncbi:MAG: hypothetical protein IKI41_04610, partial [Clostridia bacterium]|nr:hypothetical protein [Clostridia bacterium]
KQHERAFAFFSHEISCVLFEFFTAEHSVKLRFLEIIPRLFYHRRNYISTLKRRLSAPSPRLSAKENSSNTTH